MHKPLQYFLMIILSTSAAGQTTGAIDTSKVDFTNPMIDLAVFAANHVSDSSTFYTHETDTLNLENTLTNLLATPPFVYSDCSGWVSYCMEKTAKAAYQPVYKTRQADHSYPQAYKYYGFFNDLSESDTLWQSDTDLSTMPSGSILSWCMGTWCEGTRDRDFNDTGHIMLVLNVRSVVKDTTLSIETNTMISAFYDSLKSQVSADLKTAKIYELWVVDDSGTQHGSTSFYDSISPIKDLRNYQHYKLPEGLDTLDISTDPRAGGMGAGVIYVAQWEKDQTRQYAHLFNRDNSVNEWVGNDGALKMAWGLPQRFDTARALVNEIFHGDSTESTAGNTNQAGNNSSHADFVEIVNHHAVPLDISGYTLSDSEKLRHVFPKGTVLLPDQAIVVFSGELQRSLSFGCALTMPASTGTLGFDKADDELQFKDVKGLLLDHIVLEEATGTSLTRHPEHGAFVSHSELNNQVHSSPGSDYNGSAFRACFEFEQNSVSVTEGNSLDWVSREITKLLMIGTSKDSAVFQIDLVTESSTATGAGSVNEQGDFLSLFMEGIITIRPDMEYVPLIVRLFEDSDLEADETLTLRLRPTDGNLVPLGPNQTLTVTILDDDQVVTSIPLEEIDDVKVYPNPVTERLHIQSQTPFDALFFTLSGKELKRAANLGNTTWDVSGLDPGIYLMVIKKNGRVYSKKIVIN